VNKKDDESTDAEDFNLDAFIDHQVSLLNGDVIFD